MLLIMKVQKIADYIAVPTHLIPIEPKKMQKIIISLIN